MSATSFAPPKTGGRLIEGRRRTLGKGKNQRGEQMRLQPRHLRQIEVDVVAVGDHEVGRLLEHEVEEPLAIGDGFEGMEERRRNRKARSAGTGEGRDAKSLGTGARGRQRPQRPGVAERLVRRAAKQSKRVLGIGREPSDTKREEAAASVHLLARDVAVAHRERGWCFERGDERDLHVEGRVGGGWKQVLDRAATPAVRGVFVAGAADCRESAERREPGGESNETSSGKVGHAANSRVVALGRAG